MKKTALLKWSMLLLIVLTSGCALYRNDRSFVPESKYTIARQFFMQTGSLDLTEHHLHDLQWRRAEINESIYRLQKEFKVLPEDLARPRGKRNGRASPIIHPARFLMEFLQHIIDIILHLDRYLGDIIRDYGFWTYLILFLIIFCETGLVVTPFLPGDSLLFAVGAFAARGDLRLWWILILLSIAAIIGDALNYYLGYLLGPKLAEKGKLPFIKKKHLDRTHQFYEKYGKKTIILARFVPIVRTFAPFVAGIGSMSYRTFALYNVIGGLLWIFSLTLGGYFFGNFDVVKNNFGLVTIAIIIISILPLAWDLMHWWMESRHGGKPPFGDDDDKKPGASGLPVDKD